MFTFTQLAAGGLVFAFILLVTIIMAFTKGAQMDDD